MDAQQLRTRSRRVTRTLVVRLVVAWLAIVLGIGLWQGYGAWLLGGGGGDAFDVALPASMVVFAVLIALPALAAASRRPPCARPATSPARWARWRWRFARVRCVRRSMSRCASVRSACGAPEFASLVLAHELPRPSPELLADTAQRLALRLKRRVAFERKMLARTASGRRRGSVAAAIPPVVLLALPAAGMPIPFAALWFVVAIEASAAGCCGG